MVASITTNHSYYAKNKLKYVQIIISSSWACQKKKIDFKNY